MVQRRQHPLRKPNGERQERSERQHLCAHRQDLPDIGFAALDIRTKEPLKHTQQGRQHLRLIHQRTEPRRQSGLTGRQRPRHLSCHRQHRERGRGTEHCREDGPHARLPPSVGRGDCRFIYEAENEKNLVQEYSYKQGGAEVKESRKVFVGQEDYYITLKADTLTNAFLMGNPFMSHLDIKKFLEVNDNVKSVVMEIGDDLQQQTVLRAGGEVVATGHIVCIELENGKSRGYKIML